MNEEEDTREYTTAEISEVLASHEEHLRTLITVEDGFIIFPQVTDYDIDLSRLDSPVAILRWVLHLGQKPWVTPDMLMRFILLAASHHGFDLSEPAVRRP